MSGRDNKPKSTKQTDPEDCIREHTHWKHEIEEHDFPAAEEYLTLVMPDPDAKAYRKKFQELRHQIVHRKAKDLLRASRLDVLPETNAHVARDIEKVHAGDKLSPILIVRGNYQKPAIIADGYHRLCAAYHLDENTDVPCVLL